MTLDEAIEHAEGRACGDKDHAQLADWLRELRRARMEIDLLKTLRDGFKADAQRYKAENAELREFSKSVWQVMTHNEPLWVWKDMEADARELRIEESE